MDVAFREYLFLKNIYKVGGKLGGDPQYKYVFLRFTASVTQNLSSLHCYRTYFYFLEKNLLESLVNQLIYS
jgi:hypothetical protein